MKLVTIIGARPQFIKAAAVSRAINEHNQSSGERIDEIIIHTGQHFDENMSDVFFNELHIPLPHYNLNINSLSHGAMTGKMLEEIEKILQDELPDYVLVYGDTNSTIAGALAAQKIQIKVIHVEAGLRSFNMKMPEEINRILTDRISNVLLCPTEVAIKNLMNEGFDNFDCEIENVGDVMQDAALFYSNKAKKPNSDIAEQFILSTIHRQENTDDVVKLRTIFESFEQISKEKQIVLPIHPRTKKLLGKLDIQMNNVKLLEPVGYLEMVWLLKNCEFVMTDSGGLQKEAFFFGKYCLTLRDQTEWVELVEGGFNKLLPIDKESIIQGVKDIPEEINFGVNLYGNGSASKMIIAKITE